MQSSSDKYIVYKHVFPNDKVYIGITMNKPKRRWDCGRGYKGQRILSCAIKKYGWENIKHYILFENLSKEEAENIEISLISEYQSNDRQFGYNFLQGGSSGYTFTMSKDTIEKMRKTLTGRKHTKEHIENVAKKNRKPILQYKLNGDFIKRWESASKIEEELKIPHSLISRCCNGTRVTAHGFCWKFESDNRNINKIIKYNHEKHYETLKERNMVTSVLQFDLEGNLIKEWDTMTSASKFYNISHSCISACCSGRTETSCGYIWKYKIEVKQNGTK